jgi:hypothetical protein
MQKEKKKKFDIHSSYENKDSFLMNATFESIINQSESSS